MNPGGVRMNLNPGPVSVAGVYELQPFGNTLVTLQLSGAELLRVIEDMCDFTITSYTDKTPETALIYVSGVSFRLEVAAKKGSRLSEVQVGRPGAYTGLDPAGSYKLVVNSFMAAGGDKNFTLKELAAKQYDTGFIDSEVTLEYVQGKTLRNAAEKRVVQKL
jgi:5'-nucleotidase